MKAVPHIRQATRPSPCKADGSQNPQAPKILAQKRSQRATQHSAGPALRTAEMFPDSLVADFTATDAKSKSECWADFWAVIARFHADNCHREVDAK